MHKRSSQQAVLTVACILCCPAFQSYIEALLQHVSLCCIYCTDMLGMHVLMDEHLAHAMQAHVSNVCQQYGSMVSELIGMLHKTEQSLARVRKNKPADVSAAAGSEMSSIQKISLQLLLDIKV